MASTETPEAQRGDVLFALSWRAESGRLRGELEARNTSNHPVRLSGKPGLTPIGRDGDPLDAETIVTLEFRPPGYVELAPGERARAPVGWGAWDGPPASGRVVVKWDGGEIEVMADGPRQPEADKRPTNLWSSWFKRVE